MTKLEALKDLAAMVEAGNQPMASFFSTYGVDGGLAVSAYNGSLDAAKALHEALLPGWHWEIDNKGFVEVLHPYDYWIGQWPDENPTNPARAWLLAILNTLIMQEDK